MENNIFIIISDYKVFHQAIFVGDFFRTNYGFSPNFITIYKVKVQLYSQLRESGFPVQMMINKSKIGLIKSCLLLYLKFKRTKPQVVHYHFYTDRIIGSIASWLSNVPERIYTRHYSDIHHHEHKKGKLIDKIISYLSTKVIGISNVVINYLKEEGVDKNKLVTIPNIINRNSFSSIEEYRIDRIKSNLSISGKSYPIIGMISRFTLIKGTRFWLVIFL